MSIQTNGYKFLDGIPYIASAVLREQQTAGTDGGTFTSGAWQKRVLNTEEDASGIVTLASGVFTLQAGTYFITGGACGYSTNYHQTRIRNTSDNTTPIVGVKAWSSSANAGWSYSNLMGFITITGSKTFELQHRCGTTRATDGFGLSSGNSGEVEVYAQVSIQRLA